MAPNWVQRSLLFVALERERGRRGECSHYLNCFSLFSHRTNFEILTARNTVLTIPLWPTTIDHHLLPLKNTRNPHFSFSDSRFPTSTIAAMAAYVGILVSDPSLHNQFTQVELRSLNSHVSCNSTSSSLLFSFHQCLHCGGCGVLDFVFCLFLSVCCCWNWNFDLVWFCGFFLVVWTVLEYEEREREACAPRLAFQDVQA